MAIQYRDENLNRRRRFKNEMRRMLELTSECMAQNQLVYWLDRGTLLGAWRSRAFIHRDFDIDLKVQQSDWLRILAVLSEALPDDLKVTALHHGDVIRPADESHATMWFANDGGEHLVAEQEGYREGVYYHTATALVVHKRDSFWKHKPNLDLYSFRINQYHDCMPQSLDKPWLEDGKQYLCSAAKRPRNQLMLFEYVFPLSRIRMFGRHYPVPAQTEAYLTQLFGYLGEDAVQDRETRLWVKSDQGRRSRVRRVRSRED